jgi:flavodoxin
MKKRENGVKCLIVVYSYHHNNSAKIANVFKKILKADLKTPDQVTKQEIDEYDLIGLGSGIDSGKHYKQILDFAEGLVTVKNKNSFIFSTSAVQGESKVSKDHACLREKLISKGFTIVDEFSCKGYNTNSFLKYLGGMNKGRPNSNDLEEAKTFAKSLLKKGNPSL